MKTTMRVTKNTLSIFVVIVATMNVALAETETQEPISDIFAGMFKHHFSEDWSFAVGSKVWIHDWQTAGPAFVELNSTGSQFLPNSRGFVASRTSSDTDTTLIPVASLRYKNLFVTAGHYLDTNFDFPENTAVQTIQEPIVNNSFVLTDILRTSKLSAGRLEWDASVGYFLHPYVAVTAGYKFIEQDFTETVTSTFRFVSVIDGSSQTQRSDETIKSKTEISGPFVGLAASVPIGGGFGVYGNFAYGFLEAEFEAPRQPNFDEQSLPYILADGGFTYTQSTDYLPVWMPLSSATVYAGYRYQDISTETGTTGDLNDDKGKDVTKGFVIGVNLNF